MPPKREPNLNCPFTGKPIEVRRVAGGLGYMGISSSPDGGYTTRIFGEREELEYFLSTRNGVLPNFPKHTPIEVRELVRPNPEVAKEDEKERLLDEQAREHVEKIDRARAASRSQ